MSTTPAADRFQEAHEEEVEALRPEEVPVSPRGSEGRHSAQSSRGQDPWARDDPWAASRKRQQIPREDYMKFLQWQANQAQGASAPATAADPGWGWGANHGGFQGQWRQWGYAANDEAERTAAGPPPTWDGTTEFRDFRIKAQLWLRTTRTPPMARGLLLLKGLTGGPWEDLRYLASDEKWLNSPDNGKQLLDLMNSRDLYGEEERESMLAACARLTFHLRRQKGDTARAFLSKWDNAERKVRDKGVTLPNEYLGFLLVNALQLGSDQVKLMLNYTKGSLQLADVKSWLRVHETDLTLDHLGNDKDKKKVGTASGGATQNYYMHEAEVQKLEACEMDDDEPELDVLLSTIADLEDDETGTTTTESYSFTESEAKELLLTMARERQDRRPRTFHGAQKAKKNRDLARGYGAGRDGAIKPGNYKVSIEEIQKRTKCNLCGKIGHWKRECPLAKTASASDKKEVHYMESYDEVEFFYVEHELVDEPPGLEYEPNYVEYMETASMEVISETANFGQKSHGSADFEQYMSVPCHPCYHLVQASDGACATLDTGCQRMAIGINTLRKLAQTQPSSLPITFKNERHQFRSVHTVSTTHRVARIPSSIGQRGSILKPAVFEEGSSRDAPFLLSLPFLLHGQCTLVLNEQAGLSLHSKRCGFKIPCHLGPTGALRVPIQQFTDAMFGSLRKQIPSDRGEYEVLRVETWNDSACDPVLKPSVPEQIPSSHAPAAAQAQPRRAGGLRGEGAHGLGPVLPPRVDGHQPVHGPSGPRAGEDHRPPGGPVSSDGGDCGGHGALLLGQAGNYLGQEAAERLPGREPWQRESCPDRGIRVGLVSAATYDGGAALSEAPRRPCGTFRSSWTTTGSAPTATAGRRPRCTSPTPSTTRGGCSGLVPSVGESNAGTSVGWMASTRSPQRRSHYRPKPCT